MKSSYALEVKDISKTFASVKAVDGLSFEVKPGKIFGLLGPNGAGKTTSIRMILDIIKPDSGHISVLGGPMTEEKKGRPADYRPGSGAAALRNQPAHDDPDLPLDGDRQCS